MHITFPNTESLCEHFNEIQCRIDCVAYLPQFEDEFLTVVRVSDQCLQVDQHRSYSPVT